SFSTPARASGCGSTGSSPSCPSSRSSSCASAPISRGSTCRCGGCVDAGMTTTIARPTVARDHCLAPTRLVDAPIYGGRYSRLFPDLPALECDEAFLHALGAPGGLCDPSGEEFREGSAAAGWPFFGQFVAHDITADRSPIADHADLDAVRNFRTPRA